MTPMRNPFAATPFDSDPATPGPVAPSTLPAAPGVTPDQRARDRQRLRMAVAGLQQSAPQNAGSPLGALAHIFNAGAQGYAQRKMGQL